MQMEIKQIEKALSPKYSFFIVLLEYMGWQNKEIIQGIGSGWFSEQWNKFRKAMKASPWMITV